MITPSPTTTIAPSLARGIALGTIPATANKPAMIRLGVLGTSYDLHLVTERPIHVEEGKKLVGTIQAQARRVDVVESGGRYIEPVIGRPRRVQGVVIAADPVKNLITVDASVPLTCHLTDARQHNGSLKPGAFVSFDVLDGATFTQARS